MSQDPQAPTIELDRQQVEIAALKEQLAKAESEKENALRTAAEYENARKRAVRDAETDKRFASAKLVLDLLAALDNLDRAVEAAQKAGEAPSLVQGVMATQTQILDTLKRHGIAPIESLGKPFDPNLHQAVSMQPSADQPPNTVLSVLQKGFTIHDRVLRPATVVVSAAG
jgi:molecular chaperone GrpE